MENRTLIALISVMAMIGVGFAGYAMISDDSDAATDYGTATNITIAPGMRYTYTPSWPSDVGTVTQTIELQKSGSVSGTNVNIATISNGTLTVNIPSGATAGTVYHVVIKAMTTNPAQTAYIYITFTVTANLAVSGTQSNIIVGGTVDMTPTATGMGTKTWSVKSGTSLPTGLNLNTSTGKVTGTISTAGNYTINLTCTSSYGEVKDLAVSFAVKSVLSPTNSPASGVIVYVTA